MDKITAQRIVRDTFKAQFDKGRYRNFINELCNGFDESKAQSMAMIKAFERHIKSCQRLGTFESQEGELADILIVHLTESYKLERTRTALRDFVGHKLKRGDGEDNSYKEAALVAFVAPDSQSWRFSYVRMEYQTKRDPKTGKIRPEERLTPARRYSYLVGEQEECHTAQSRFLALLQNTNDTPTLDQIEDAFSVEAVTDEFFDEYADFFEEIKGALEKLAKKDTKIGAEFSRKQVRTADFAKKLMGQIVFLYFIQKKGWLGVEKGKDWGTGPRDFLRRLARGDYVKYENFFNDVLEPLFYDTLATDRGPEAWCKRFNCRIPFLNGGLFEPLVDYDWRKTDITLPNELFTNDERFDDFTTGTGLLDMFDRYNFTVNEAEPLEKEVAIDPEMLGKVFENLIEENLRKGLGSYYTPREVVHYMCQESLINYLDTALNASSETIGREKRKQTEFGDEKSEQTLLRSSTRREIVPRVDIEIFVRLGDQISHYESVDTQYAIKMPKSIDKNARAIDDKLADITICDPAVGSGAFPVGMMADIVRARSALTSYLDDIQDRTSYHFKRHAIQNSLYGVDIDPGAVEIAKLRLWLSLVVDEEDVKHIKPLPNLFYKVVTGNSLLGVEKDLFNQQLFRQLEELKPRYFDESDKDKKDRYKKQIEDTIHELTSGKEAFDFEIYFSEIFHKRGGFDVVIANPPYISYGLRGGQKMSTDDKKYLKQAFPNSAEYKISMYAIFMEVGIRLSNPQHGVSCFIVPDSFLLGMYFSQIRAYTLRECDIRQIVLLPFSVFKAVVGFSVVYLFEKSRQDHAKNTFHAITAESTSDLERRRVTEFSYPQRYFSGQRRSKFRLFFDQCTFDIVEKCRSNAIELDRLIAFRSGLIGLDGQDAISSDCKRGAKWLPGILSGGDVHRFVVRPHGAYILYDKPHIKSGYECVDYSVPKLFMRQTGDNLICAFDSNGLLCLNNVHVANEKSGDANLKFLCGLLNSKLMNFFYRAISLETGRVMPQTDIETLDDLPIQRDKAIEAEVARLVDECIKSPKSAKAIHAIDRLIYKLYGLTSDQIRSIDNAIEENVDT